MTGKQKGARANREGKPWQRTDGRWVARVYPPPETLERKPRYVYGKTRKEAAEKRAALEIKLGRGLPSDPGQTLGDYFHRWLYVTLPQYVAAGELAESTMDSYRDNAEKHIVPEDADPSLRHIRLTELSGPMIREWQHQLGRKPSGRAGEGSAKARPNCRRPRRCHRAPSPTAGPSCTRHLRTRSATRPPALSGTSCGR